MGKAKCQLMTKNHRPGAFLIITWSILFIVHQHLSFSIPDFYEDATDLVKPNTSGERSTLGQSLTGHVKGNHSRGDSPKDESPETFTIPILSISILEGIA